MNHRNNPLQMLADRAKRGDLTAKAQLREQMEPQMVFVVRYALNRRSERTPIDRLVLAAARRLELASPRAWMEDQQAFILKVARSVCSQVVDNIRATPESGFLSAETVADFFNPAVRMTA